MKRSHTIEEILETLWIRTQEQLEPHITRRELFPDDKSFQEEMEQQDLITINNGQVRLTKKGLQEGSVVVRRHRLAELLLTQVIDVRSEDLVHTTACDFEHFLKEGIDDKVCNLLGHPSLCPHGKPIPPGKCCGKRRIQVGQVISLSSLKPEQSGKIAYLHTRDSKELKKLMSMGLLPGTPIRLIQRFPSYVFRIGYTQFAVDKKIADEIFIKLSTA